MHTSIQLAIGVMFGVVLAEYWTDIHWIVWPSLLILCVLRNRAWQKQSWLIGILVGASALSFQLHRQVQVVEFHTVMLDDRVEEVILGQIVGIPEQLPGRVRLMLESESARIWLTLYRRGEEPSIELKPGQWIRVPVRLKRPTNSRGVGRFDKKHQVMAKGADLIGSGALQRVSVERVSWSLWSAPAAIHAWAAKEISARPGSSDGRQLVAALAVGERGSMELSLSSALRTSGVAHLLAVSGMHVAAVASLVYFVVLLLWSYLPWRQEFAPTCVAAFWALGAAILFTGITGAKASTCRALLVAAFVLIGIILDRRIRLFHAIAWAAFALLVHSPFLLWDPGFQMSFAATGALALAFRSDPEELKALYFDRLGRVGRVLSRARDLLLASFWASLATAPIALHHFGEVSWVGLLTNVVAVPFATIVVLPLSLAALAILVVHRGAGEWTLDLAISCADGIAVMSRALASSIPMPVRAPMNTFEFGLWIGIFLILLQAQTMLGMRRVGRFWMMVSAMVLVAFFGMSRVFWAPQESESLRITFVDVGQGDAAVLELPGGKVWLVDGGGLPFVAAGTPEERQYLGESPARHAVLPYLRHRRIREIDLAILSHPHPDHYLGLQAVARALPIRELWSVHEEREIPGQFEGWLKTIESQGTIVRRPRRGLVRREEGVALRVLWPLYGESETVEVDPILSVNDNSLVIRVEFAGRSILFAGDIEEEAEEFLVSSYGSGLRADVVKVPHHGSKTSSTSAFVAAVDPILAVISCGIANRFDFPNLDVLKRWQAFSQILLRTDFVGNITVEISPESELHVESALPWQ